MLPNEVIGNIRRIEIRTRKIVDELTAGAYHSVFKGRGMEFNEVREYQPGDDVRTIDWNVTARMAHPFIKKFVEERELTVMLVVDVSASGDFGSAGRSKNEQAAELAALLAFSAIRNNDQVGLLLFSEQTELFVPPRKGRRHVLRLIRELLAHKRQKKGTNIRAALETLTKVMNRKAVVFMISDMIDEGWEQTLRIVGRKHDLVSLRMLDRREESLSGKGFLNLEDAESGDTFQLQAGGKGNLRQFLLQTVDQRLKQQDIFKKSGLDLIDIYVGEDYVKPLMQFFRKREKRR